MLFPAYQAWVNFAPVCPFQDNNVAGMQGLDTNSSAGMWHHPASASLSSSALAPVSGLLGTGHNAFSSSARFRCLQTLLLVPTLVPCQNMPISPSPLVSIKLPWESCEPEKENWSSLQKRSLCSNSQCRCSQASLGTGLGIIRCFQQTVYDINLLL